MKPIVRRALPFRILLVLAVSAVAFSVPAQASSRASHRLGVYGDYNFGTELLGANLGFNAIDWLRLHFGYAFPVTSDHHRNFDAQAQGGVKFLFPSLDFSPFAGVASGASSGTLSINIGVDYTASDGLNLGAGWSQVDTHGASGVFIYLGKYF